jgi:ketosteroid isomerase-like protein
MQRHLVTILTLLLVGAGVWFTARRPSENSAATPEDCVQAMLDASRRGDTAAYLDCFSETMRPQLDATRQQMGEARFREYLAESQSPVMGVATSRLPETRPERARIEVEFILRDKNQRQTIELRNDAGRWQIEAMSQSVYTKPPIPYGTKVFEEPKTTTNSPLSRVTPKANQ